MLSCVVLLVRAISLIRAGLIGLRSGLVQGRGDWLETGDCVGVSRSSRITLAGRGVSYIEQHRVHNQSLSQGQTVCRRPKVAIHGGPVVKRGVKGSAWSGS